MANVTRIQWLGGKHGANRNESNRIRSDRPILRHVEARLESTLGPFSRWFLQATVRLEDINGDHGGDDKRCSIVVALRRHGVEVAEATNVDLYAAIDEAASRMRRSVSRAIKRHLSRERKDPQRPGTLMML